MTFDRSQMGCHSNEVCAQRVMQTLNATLKAPGPVDAQESAAAFMHNGMTLAMVYTSENINRITLLAESLCWPAISHEQWHP